MRQHPLLAFATAATTLSITLFAAVGSVGAATATHPSDRSTAASRSTLAAGSTLASRNTLAALAAPAYDKSSGKTPKHPKRDAQGRRVEKP
jgi:hypothetical protein